MSELGLETPPAATLPSSPSEEGDDIVMVDPPNIKRAASSSYDISDPRAFVEYGKRLKHCQDKSCQHVECNLVSIT